MASLKDPYLNSLLGNVLSNVTDRERKPSFANQGDVALRMNTYARIAVCQLNCHAMDFDGIYEQHREGLTSAVQGGVTYVVFPELSLCGYSCEDHFFEADTEVHCWGSINKLIMDMPSDMLVDVGLPVTFRGARYNCRAYLLNGKLIGVRPKCYLAMEGNYREARYFTAWDRNSDNGLLRIDLKSRAGPKKPTEVPFGLMILNCNDVTIASEICEEMWTPRPLHVDYYLQGVDIISNASGSHHSLQKLDRRMMIVKSATVKTGGVYMYSNFKGCDGTRNNFDGKSAIAMNGNILSTASSLTIGNDVELLVEEIDISLINVYRSFSPTGMTQGMKEQMFKKPVFVNVDINICRSSPLVRKVLPPWHARSPMNKTATVGFGMRDPATNTKELCESEESVAAGACWLWDYLRRVKGAKGFFLPLSGGADSASCLVMLHYMCLQLVICMKGGCKDVIKDVCIAVSEVEEVAVKFTAGELCKRLVCCGYEATGNSSEQTKNYSRELAEEVGATWLDIDIDNIVNSFRDTIESKLVNDKGEKHKLRFLSQGGTTTEDLILQNIQSRSRMVISYAFASAFPGLMRDLDPKRYGKPSNGFFLTVATGNQCETIYGYYTKYDCSSGDLNPIASLNKFQVQNIMEFAANDLNVSKLVPIINAKPSAELRPAGPEGWLEQNDEDEMGLTYAEISAFSYYRMTERCGPVRTFTCLLREWSHMRAEVVADKVKLFFTKYAQNRHKVSTLTPGLHMSSRSPDDSRYDHRQLFYPQWRRQFNIIDQYIGLLKAQPEEGDFPLHIE